VVVGIVLATVSLIQIGLVLIFTMTAGVISEYVRYRVGRTDLEVDQPTNQEFGAPPPPPAR
jgi:hypothetical protein